MMASGHLKIDGQSLKGAMISNLEVRQGLGEHWWCEVSFRLLNQERPPLEGYLGKTLEFFIVGEGGVEVTVFEGFILQGRLEYERYGDHVAKILGVTKSYLLQLTPEEDYFLKKNLQEVAQEIVGEDGLELEFNAAGAMARMSYVQWAETDFDFIKRIADDQGCFLRPTAKGIEIRRGFQDRGQTLQWQDEYGLMEFALEGRLGQPSYDGTCYDPRMMQSKSFRGVRKSPEFFAGTASGLVGAVMAQSNQLPADRLVFDGRAPKLEMYQALLEKESARSIGSKIRGYGQSRDYRLKPGDQVKLAGSNFDAQGDYGLIGVTHRYDLTNGYRNEFTATVWKDYTGDEQPAPKQISGVVPARVTAHNDPRSMGRIQIQYDWMEGSATAWARMVTPHAGGGRGFMFMPEMGDEVLVAFEHGDPERPYVVGALWNGVSMAPRSGYSAAEGVEAVAAADSGSPRPISVIPKEIAGNFVKRIVTTSGHHIQFDDTRDGESIVVATAGGQRIQLIDHCAETGGQRKMLCLSTDGDIFLSAPNGRVHIRSKFFSKEIG